MLSCSLYMYPTERRLRPFSLSMSPRLATLTPADRINCAVRIDATWQPILTPSPVWYMLRFFLTYKISISYRIPKTNIVASLMFIFIVYVHRLLKINRTSLFTSLEVVDFRLDFRRLREWLFTIRFLYVACWYGNLMQIFLFKFFS